MLEYSKLGERIRELRVYENLTQECLAEYVHVTSKHISSIENGASKVSVETLVNIANTLKTTTDYLLQDSVLSNEIYEREVISMFSRCSDDKKNRMIEYLRAMMKIDVGK